MENKQVQTSGQSKINEAYSQAMFFLILDLKSFDVWRNVPCSNSNVRFSFLICEKQYSEVVFKHLYKCTLGTNNL